MGRTGFRDQFWLRNEDGTRVLLLLSFVTRIFMKSYVGNMNVKVYIDFAWKIRDKKFRDRSRFLDNSIGCQDENTQSFQFNTVRRY